MSTAPPPGVPSGPRPRNGRKLVIVAVAAFLVLVAGAAVAGWSLWNRTLGAADVGDCLRSADGVTDFSRTDCSSAAAQFRVLGVTDDIRQCAAVLGTSRAMEAGDRMFCIGAKDADAATAINGVRRGDCVKLVGDEAAKATCGPGTYPVLKVLQNQLKSSGGSESLTAFCATVEDTSIAYGWSITTGENEPVGTWDRVFCLGQPT